MIISGHRIRNLDRHLRHINRGDTIVIGLTNLERFSDLLIEMGFSCDPQEGETILPPASRGPVSKYNAEGKYEVHKDQPMETAYRMVEWHWREWHGPYDRVERSKLVDVPYQRYPRTFIPPPSVELSISTAADGQRIITAGSIDYIDENQKTSGSEKHPVLWVLDSPVTRF